MKNVEDVIKYEKRKELLKQMLLGILIHFLSVFILVQYTQDWEVFVTLLLCTDCGYLSLVALFRYPKMSEKWYNLRERTSSKGYNPTLADKEAKQ